MVKLIKKARRRIIRTNYKITRAKNNVSETSKGIFYIIFSSLCISIMVSIVRILSENYNIFFILMLRSLFSLIFTLPNIHLIKHDLFRTDKFTLHLTRNINGFFSVMLSFYAVKSLPLSEAISISFIVPILSTISGIVFLKEKVSKKTYISSALGFAGVLVITRPGFKILDAAHFAAILSAILWSVSNVTIKIMTKTEKPQTVVFYSSFLMFFISLPFSIPYFKAIPMKDLVWFILIGFFSNLSSYTLSKSYSKINFSLAQVFDFTRLIFVSLIAYFAFGETTDIFVLIGTIIIIIGVVISSPPKFITNKFRFLFVNRI